MYNIPPRSYFCSSVGNGLFNSASLDLPFAKTKSLVDATTGSNLVNFTRASSGTYVGSDGLIKRAVTNLVLQSENLLSTPNYSGSGLSNFFTATLDSLPAPNGSTSQSVKFVSTATTSQGLFLRQTGLSLTAQVYTLSIYLYVPTQAGVSSWSLNVDFQDADGADAATSTLFDQWVRVKITKTLTANRNFIDFNFRINGGATPSTAGITLYAWGAQLEAAAFATSYIPTTTSAVTRAADVASISGNNFGTTNLLEYSEEFDNVYWAKIRCSVTPNASLAPNNTFTADAIVEDTSSNTHILQADGVTTAVSGTTYTYSWYLKAGEKTALRIEFGTDNGVWQAETVDIDLSDGTLSNVSGFAATPIVQNVGNGWYRLSATVTAQASANGVIRMMPLVGGSVSYTGDGTSKYFIWGAQLEQSDVATPYVKSNVTFTSRASSATYYDKDGVIQTAAVNEARTAAYLPDGNGNFISAGPLLLEGAGTNLLLRSEEFNSASWTRSNTTASVDVTTAPDGTTTAEKIVETTATSEHNVRQDTTSQSAGTYTFSIFAKAGERSFIQFVATGVLGSYRANFDLSNGTLGSVDSQLAGSIVDVGDGWYRCIVSATSSTSGTLRAQWNIVTSSTAARVESYAGDGTSGIYIWGAQLEASPYATSYIPTAGSQVTRAADVSDGGANTFGNSWYRQDEGTVFSAAQQQYQNTVGGALYWVFSDATSSNFHRAFGRAASTLGAGTTVSNVSQADRTPPTGTITAGSKVNLSYGYKANDFRAAANGVTDGTDASGSLPTITTLEIGGSQYMFLKLNGTIRRLTYWPSRLPNDTLQTITL